MQNPFVPPEWAARVDEMLEQLTESIDPDAFPPIKPVPPARREVRFENQALGLNVLQRERRGYLLNQARFDEAPEATP